MPTWTEIANAQVQQGAAVDQTLMTALRDNCISIAEGGAGAPIGSAWHPYDRTEAGGSENGLLWSHAVDGNISLIETPVLDTDGFEYMLVFDNLRATVAGNVQLAVRRSSDDTYGIWLSMAAFNTGSSAVTSGGVVTFADASSDLNTHSALCSYANGGGIGGSASDARALIWENTSSIWRINRIQIRPTAGALDSGRVFLMRRRLEDIR